MLRVIKELQPRFVVGENVAGIVSMALDQVLADLEAAGYEARAVIIPACAVDAPHRRDRCAILAHTASQRWNGTEPFAGETGSSRLTDRDRWSAQPGLGGVADGLPGWLDRGMSSPGYWLPEPEGVPRVATGIKDRVNRLKCLGNAVVPQQFYPIFQAIADVERMINP